MGEYSIYKKAFLGLLTTLLVFLIVETLVRLAETVRADMTRPRPAAAFLPKEFIPSTELGWERRPGFKGLADDGVPREFDSEGYPNLDSKKVADQIKKKIVFIGDSNTYGFKIPPSASYPEAVGELLPGVNTINLGVSGYTSYQGCKTLEKYLPRLRPAAVVASFNFNDRCEVQDGEDPDGSGHFARLYRSETSGPSRASRALEILHFYGALRSGMRRVGLVPQPARLVRVDQLRPRVGENEYRKNLSDMAAQTKHLGIPLIFVILRDNPLDTGYLNKGIEKLEASDFNAAIDYLTPLRSGLWFSDLARLYLAKAYEANGEKENAARVLFTDSGRLFRGPIRLDTTYNQIMREVARENQIKVVDAATVLEEDPYVYFDIVHFSPAGHRKVSQLLAPRLAEVLRKTMQEW